ncbi:hypothetical protein CCUS01_11271 [Colletotrichum cuscutae]|uniref:PD-(D/E)XK nuclease-like domain-containing protein n=1 Tax=Colletotrichum cuscutae TaxID=1209917 RepID=A0AAI9XK94_9PEZI|nr:hypothetical protein CCUS01_11271 [Colletotrichum cuscutae]
MSNPEIDLDDEAVYDASDLYIKRYGPIPSFAEVNAIVQTSQYGIAEKFDEASWDREVHFRVLALSLRRPLAPARDGLINFAPSTTAAIHHKLIEGTPPRMVDFCVFVDPESTDLEHKPVVTEAIDRMRHMSGYSSINHTSHFLFRNKTISVSIESKQRGSSQDDAHLQIGTWHAAQWTYLERLAQIQGATLQGLAFLPGLIIEGEDWHFVASTREGASTVAVVVQEERRLDNESRRSLPGRPGNPIPCLVDGDGILALVFIDHPRRSSEWAVTDDAGSITRRGRGLGARHA